MTTKRGEAIPDDLAAALRADAGLLRMWDALRPSCQQEYVRSVLDAKRPETRARRIEAAIKGTTHWYERHHPSEKG